MTKATQVGTGKPEKTTTVLTIDALVVMVKSGEKVDFSDLERLRKAGYRDLWLKHELEYGARRRVYIPLDVGDEIREEKGETLYPLEHVGINGVTIKVPKGIDVEVPYMVADLLETYVRSKQPRKHIVQNLTRPTFTYSF